MKHIRLALMLALAALSFLSCKKEGDPTADNKLYDNYFPLQTGAWRIYEADSAVYNGLTDSASYHTSYQVREEVESSFTDTEGNTVYRIVESHRADENSPWEVYKVFSAYKNKDEAILKTDNTSYVKLVFPVRDGVSWDANKYNTHDSLDLYRSQYREVHRNWQAGGHNFDSTAFVELESDSNFVTRLYKHERYAWNTGKVYFRHDSLDIQRPVPEDPTILKIRGYQFRQTIKSFGQ